MKRIGLIVNPIAGMGGRVGLKGTDGPAAQARARELGARPEAPARAVEALRSLAAGVREIELLSYPAEMGADEARAAGFSPIVIGEVVSGRTSSEDTRRAALDMADRGVDLLLFAGGDGTARDVLDAVGQRVAALGIPAGVKVHSALFGTTPRDAGRVALSYVRGEIQGTRDAEVMDSDEDALRQGIVSARLHGYLRTPDDTARVQAVKAGGTATAADSLERLASAVAESMEAGVVYVMGPGSTVAAIMDAMGLEGALLGVDVVRDGALLAADVGESQILELMEGEDARVVVTVIGGQGYILGRGNGQISPRVIRKAGSGNVIVAATKEKLASLGGKPLLVDTGDAALDADLAGYARVMTGRGEYAMRRIGGSEPG